VAGRNLTMPLAAEVLNEDIKELKADIRKLDVGLAELRTEVRDAIGLAKWAYTVLAATILSSGVGAIIWGASLTTKVYGVESRGNEKFQEISARVDKLEARIDARFDKLDASIAKLLELARQPTPKPGP
jgi:outer membrane murein-binding lipoprotein Lpp